MKRVINPYKVNTSTPSSSLAPPPKPPTAPAPAAEPPAPSPRPRNGALHAALRDHDASMKRIRRREAEAPPSIDLDL